MDQLPHPQPIIPTSNPAHVPNLITLIATIDEFNFYVDTKFNKRDRKIKPTTSLTIFVPRKSA